MSNLDLNLLRNTLRQNAERGEIRPDEPRRKIFVDHNGKIRHGSEVDPADRQDLSEVRQDTFAGLGSILRGLLCEAHEETHKAAPSPPFAGDRLSRDRAVVLQKLPPGTREISVDGTTGFVYRIADELGRHYTMAVYFDGAEYQVKVVEPQIEGQYGIADAHVFPDGRLCLRPPAGGMPTLAEAYAKSVLWANGFTIRKATGRFPWPSHR